MWAVIRNSSLLVLIFLNVISWTVVFDLSESSFLKVIFFDVGQGDAIFIETPKKHQILIDGGPTSIILEKLGKEMPFWDRTIDLIILTHPEKDHLFGLIEVLKRYKIENILWTGVVRDISEFKEWEKLIQEEKAEIRIARAGQAVKLARTVLDNVDNLIYLDVLYPLENLAGQAFKDSNGTSIVSRLVFNKNSLLFTGDIYKSGEQRIIKNGASLESLESDILKIAHHGSKTSSGEEFLKKVLPKIAIISVGKDNRYGHPNQGVLEVLDKYGIRILRTDEEGDIKVFSDGIQVFKLDVK